MGLSCSVLVEMSSGRGKSIRHVAPYHFGGKTRKLAGSRDVSRGDCLEERGWAWVSQSGVDEPHVAGSVLLANVVGRDVHSPTGPVGRSMCVLRRGVQVHNPQALVGWSVS
jgi:hypothetical protein